MASETKKAPEGASSVPLPTSVGSGNLVSASNLDATVNHSHLVSTPRRHPAPTSDSRGAKSLRKGISGPRQNTDPKGRIAISDQGARNWYTASQASETIPCRKHQGFPCLVFLCLKGGLQ